MTKAKGKGPSFRLAQAPGPDQIRLFCYLFFNLSQRIDNARRRAYAGDLEVALISEAIALSAIEPLMRDPQMRDHFRSVRNVVGVEGQRGVNALSIAAATGIPRETVRRKIRKLIELGAITQVKRGEYVMKPGFLQRTENLALLQQAINDTIRFINTALDQGLFTLTGDEPTAPSSRTARPH
ncbi:hypothetical protein SAMN02745126_02889 [Enhydrobacter aerosaccus]|uniref:IclR helix-turn-helix domain-containing protein n=1 Tax=Enhydrobacter aerosaccus TaxID=225324 RepID=A0A1T4PLK9_9HYPH|nr:helix-turn-helix transcriptional regulator [Enhydrobacter aerosaccus]SJZ92440.1 hypothetical protein SAMN02745126_02889 [Enhydrobacter aerosaccus]